MVEEDKNGVVKFTPDDDDEEVTLDAGYAFARAAPLIDILEHKAMESHEFDSLHLVAELWIRVGEALAPGPEDVDDPWASRGKFLGFHDEQTETEILGEK